jgi:hypothetical protein
VTKKTSIKIRAIKQMDSTRIINTDRFTKYYKFAKKKLGSGCYGIVKKAINKQDGKEYACKIVSRKGDYLRFKIYLI